MFSLARANFSRLGGYRSVRYNFAMYCSTNIKPIKMAFSLHEDGDTEQGPPLIIMHGLHGSKENFRSISKSLTKSLKRKIYCVDARNHGESPHDPRHSFAHMAADVAEFYHTNGITKASVMGHSMGGKCMMYFVLKYPQLVDRTIIVDISPVSKPNNFSRLGRLFAAMKDVSIPNNVALGEGRVRAARQMRAKLGDLTELDFILLNLRKAPDGKFYWRNNIDALQRSLKAFDTFRADIEGLYPYNGPVLFICGTHSNFMDPNDWNKIKEIFPNADIQWLDAGHLVHFDQPIKFNHTVVRFLTN